MHRFILLSAACLSSILLILVFLWVQAINDKPNIIRQVTITPEYVARAKQTIKTHRHQSNLQQLVTVSILSGDVDIAANYLAYRFIKGNAQVLTTNSHALIRFNFPLSAQGISGYLNFEALLVQTSNLPQLQALRIGELRIPNFVTSILVSQINKWLQSNYKFNFDTNFIKHLEISQDQISVTYRYNLADLSQQQNRLPLISKQAREQLLRYQTLLVNNSQLKDKTTVALSEILPPLMQLAATYSENGDALAENRAVILVVAFHVLGLSLDNFIPDTDNWPQPTKQTVTLDGRNDFSKHFMVSAAIAAYTDTILADAIGLYKEIEDSRSGSGFSFNDIAANRAGTRFTEKAMANQSSARQLQQQILLDLNDSDLMPPWKDLPEHLPEATFKLRFGGINTPAYQQVMQEIETRVSALPLLN